MDEEIRLVIWDLDETFWIGTITEGGIKEYSRFNHELVISLARRGIMSSICSKNNFDEVRTILEKEGIWEYFIFPSINWQPKAERVLDIITKVKLRPSTVLFIDDNRGNLAEVESFIPSINVADQFFIPTIKNHPLFLGKEDTELSRLKQYKILEEKTADETESEGDNTTFLRNSDIRVSVIHDIESHLDRAVELINRTNQLNFTKLRLPEDSELAKAALLKMITDLPYARTAGLIKVSDKYGDYGFVGFYLCEQFHTDRKLIHFCFSCRTLGMGIEKWVYDRLGKPSLAIQGDVQLDLNHETAIDWITFDPHPDLVTAASSAAKVPKIFLRGGCDLDAVAHYLSYHCDKLISETNFVRDGQFVRKDSLVNLKAGLEPFTAAKLNAIHELGFVAEDFQSRFLNEASEGDIVILSLWAELMLHSYKNKTEDLHILMQLRPLSLNYTNTLSEQAKKSLSEANITAAQSAEFTKRCEIMNDNYISDFFDEASLKVYLNDLLNRIPKGVRVIILLPSEKIRGGNNTIVESRTHVQSRKDIKHLISERPNVSTVDIMDSIYDDAEYMDVAHFSRMVYFRIYQQILDAITLGQSELSVH